MEESYSYTSTTTDANGNVVSETKKSSTKTGGTDNVKTYQSIPHRTLQEENIVLMTPDRRYVGNPGKVEMFDNPVGVQNLDPRIRNKKKDSGVLNMSEKDFSLLDLLNNKKGLPGTKEKTQKVLLPKANKEHLTASEWKDLFGVINSKPTNKDMNNYYKLAQKEREENKSLGYRIGTAIAGSNGNK